MAIVLRSFICLLCVLLAHSCDGLVSSISRKSQRNVFVLALEANLFPIANELFTSNSLVRDSSVSCLVIAEVYIWLKTWTTFAKNGLLPSNLTRKIIHTGSAPLFMMHWPLYSMSPYSRLIASCIPLLQIVRFYFAGTKKPHEAPNSDADAELVAAVSRTGDKGEVLQGPLIYSVVLFFATLLFYRDSPVGVVAICQMAVGDGVADIVGRRIGTIKWPFAINKSVQGSLAFLMGGFISSLLILKWLHFTGFMPMDLTNSSDSMLKLFFISLISALVELIPGVDDNISVPIVSAMATYLLFPQ